MALYMGQPYHQDQVSIWSPDLRLLQSIFIASDVKFAMEYWLAEAQKQEDVLYFSIFLGKDLIGQILLHDLNLDARESLIAYHLFDPRLRGQGYGTIALRLLQSYVMRQTGLRKLIMITSRDNLASQSIAQKCGFPYVGGSREDPINEMVLEWHVPRNL